MFNWAIQMITMFRQYTIPIVVALLSIATTLIAYNSLVFGLLVAAAATVLYGISSITDPDKDGSIAAIVSVAASLAILSVTVIL